MLIAILFTALLLMPTQSFPQDRGTVEGYVKDAQTEEPLPGANIILSGTLLGAAADNDGYFRIPNVPVGTYKLKVTMLGYRTVLRTLEVPARQTVKLSFFLQTAILKLSEGLVVTAEKSEAFYTSMPLAVFKQAELARLNPITTAEALSGVSGISLARPGAWGVKPVIGGLRDERIVVLVDGARLNQACPFGMDACVATINPGQIERIEVIKGPHSVTYGSGNLGGVINIITRNPPLLKNERWQLTPHLNLGYYSAFAGRSGRMNLEGGYKTLEFALGAGIQKYGDYRTARARVVNSGFYSRDLNSKFSWDVSRHHRLRFSSQHYLGKDIGYPSASAVIPRERRRQYTLGYSAAHLSKWMTSLEASLALQSLSHSMRISSFEPKVISRGDSRSQTYSGSLKGDFVPVRTILLSVGLDFYRWRIQAKRRNQLGPAQPSLITTLPKAKQWNFGLFTEGKMSFFPMVFLTLGIRADWITAKAIPTDDAKTTNLVEVPVTEQFISASLGILYQISKAINVVASWGRGFRPPTPIERYLSVPTADGYQRLGAVHLRPEKSHSLRLGFKGMTNGVAWDVALFQNNLSDLISIEVDPNLPPHNSALKGVKRYINLEKATIRGLETVWSLALTPTLTLSVSATYTWGEDRSRNLPLPQIPPLEGEARIKYQNTKLWGELTGRLVADQERFDAEAGEVRTPGFVVFDLRVGVKFTENVDLNLAVENMLNRHYRQHLNLAQLLEPGKNVYLGLHFGLPLNKTVLWKLRKSKTKMERVTLKVAGIDCKFCAQTVRSILKRIEGVVSVEVDLEKELAVVEFQKGKTSVSRLTQTLNNSGYKATPSNR